MRFRRPMCYFAVIFALFLMLLTPHLVRDAPSLCEDGGEIVIYGKLVDQQIKGDRCVLFLKHVIPAETVSKDRSTSRISNQREVRETEKRGEYGLLCYLDEKERGRKIAIGSRLKVSGRYDRFEAPENEGQFDAGAYYRIRGYHGRIFRCDILACEDRNGFRNRLYEYREKLKTYFSAYLSPESAGIMQALLLGDQAMLDQEIKELYRNAGIVHILSLSGLHIATLGFLFMNSLHRLLLKALLRIRLKRLSAVIRGCKIVTLIFSVTVLLLYCLMTGTAVSTVRALLMFGLGAVADLCDRTYDLISAAALASLVVLCLNPLYLYDAGFLLSFTAVLSIGILYSELLRMSDKLENNRIVQGLTLSLSVTLGTLPMVALQHSQFAPAGILLNLIVVPLLSVVLLLGIVLLFGGILTQCVRSGIGEFASLFFDGVCRGSAWITDVILKLYEWMAERATSFRFAVWIIGRPKWWQVILYYFFLLSGILLVRRFRKKENHPLRKDGSDRRVTEIDQSSRHIIGRETRRRMRAQRLIFCGFAMIACVILSMRFRAELEIRSLSVGQGDCSLIIGKHLPCILIDCGSSSETRVGSMRLVPSLKSNAVSCIDLIFITHFDEDHVSGLTELLQDPVYRKRIGRIVVSEIAPVIDGETENYRLIRSLAAASDIPICTIRAGERIPLSASDYALHCLSPGTDASCYENTNEASLVLLLTEGAFESPVAGDLEHGSGKQNTAFRALFAADIGKASEIAILKSTLAGSRNPCFGGLSYLKVAHHGSSGSSSEEFMEAVVSDATLAVISVGAENRYGHPHRETLDRLSAAGAMLLRTDECGEIIFRKQGDEFSYRTFRNGFHNWE